MLVLQERWVLFIVHALLSGPLGFNEISRRATGVSSATLSQRLELLEREGLLSKRVLSTMPPRTEYRLTASGEALRPVLEAVELWSLARNEGKAGTSVVGAD
jgi:DNA-binding HxlR family transcriptional regulator